MIELIAVLVVIALVALFAVPAIESMLKGSQVSIAGNAVIDELNLARQTALAKNQPVEVRFYCLPDSETGNGSAKHYRAMQLFESAGNGEAPIRKPLFFPSGIIIEEDASKSSILLQKDGPLTSPAPEPGLLELPGYGANYEFISFRFRGNGETDMNEKPAYFTLVRQTDKKAANGLPANFVAVQIDPVSGRSFAFRP